MNNIRTPFAKRIKEMREKNKLSQRELANEMKLSSGFIAMIETGHKSVSMKVLIGFAQFFNVSTDFLLGLKDE